eukprot:18469-Heterococcus_DN1.PRE.2
MVPPIVLFVVFVHVVISSLFDAFVHITPLVIMSIVLALCSTIWCRHLCTLTLVVVVVTSSVFDVFVLVTPLITVSMLCIVVHQYLVPPVVHFVAFVHVVILSGFDVAELLTLFDIVIHQIPNAATSATAFVVSRAALFTLDS